LQTQAQDSTSANDKSEQTITIKKSDGLESLEFDTIYGRVEVNLPDDLASSDTISGTVIAEPSGETKEEIAKNEDILTGCVVEIKETKNVEEQKPLQATNAPKTTPQIITAAPTVLNEPPSIKICKKKAAPFTCLIPAANKTILVNIAYGGKSICNQPVKCLPPPPKAVIPCTLPASATCGKPFRIPGSCSGRFATSNITVAGKQCSMIAESPRQQICQPPEKISGRCPIVRCEGRTITKGMITLVPAPNLPKQTPVNKAGAAKVVFKRTGPFVKLFQPKSNNRWQATSEDGRIIFAGPYWDLGKERTISSTVTYTAPPETMSPGDKFTLEATVTGDEYAYPTGYISVDGSWINVPKDANNMHLSGYGDNKVLHISGTYPVIDARERIKEFKAVSPQAITPAMEEQVLNNLPMTRMYVSTHGAEAEVIFRYVR
jgi:hypothetical protein